MSPQRSRTRREREREMAERCGRATFLPFFDFLSTPRKTLKKFAVSFTFAPENLFGSCFFFLFDSFDWM